MLALVLTGNKIPASCGNGRGVEICRRTHIYKTDSGEAVVGFGISDGDAVRFDPDAAEAAPGLFVEHLATLPLSEIAC